MSDAPRYDTPSEDLPDMDELDRVAYDAVVRSAPRFGRFIGTGVGIGALVGLIIGLVLPNTTVVGRGVVAILVMAGFAIIGGLVAGALVVGVDGTKKAPEQAGFPWEDQPHRFEPEAPAGQDDAR